ncbi:MAG TPA: 30S ribosomal protein S20 [Desulfobacteraceae bacterium]|nr:30S ribosomal protein S20 [Desulfobacteraceae bacterium]
MANHKSALKRARQSLKRRERNKTVRTRVKSVVKDVQAAATGKAAEVNTRETLIAAQSVIDKAVKKGVLHKRTAARKISRLSKLINRMAV